MSWNTASERGLQDGPRSLWKADKSERLRISSTSSRNISSVPKYLKKKKAHNKYLAWVLGSRNKKSAQKDFFIAKSCFIIAHGCYWPHFNGIQWAFNLLNPAKNARNCVSSLAKLAFLKWNHHCIRYRDILIEVESCSGKSGLNFDWDKTWNRLLLSVGCLNCPLFSKAKYSPILKKLCHFISSLVPPNQFWMILPRNFDIGVHWSLSIWTFWWCHSWWRVDAHAWLMQWGGGGPIRSADAKGRMCWRNILPHANILREISSNIRHRF